LATFKPNAAADCAFTVVRHSKEIEVTVRNLRRALLISAGALALSASAASAAVVCK
jgi:hypothetical protein